MAAIVGILLAIPAGLVGQVTVTTERNDNLRTGQNVSEAVLTPANVASANFQKLFSRDVDGYVYAQPLYVPNVNIPGKGVHNVVYIATENDSLYAFDADSNTGNNFNPLWQVTFINPYNGITPISDSDINCYGAVYPQVGITSTPVIDLSSNTIYVLVETKENGNFFHRLHALDITTGQERSGSPVVIAGSVPGTGAGSSGGVLKFDPLMQFNRSGLLLTSGGNLFLAWASNCDNPPFHGWVMSFNKATLQRNGIWASTANGSNGGVWMSGSGIATDGRGSVYFATGNGTFDTSGSLTDFGDSTIRMFLSSTSGLTVADYFTPYDQLKLDNNDEDVGSGGTLLLPDQPGPYPHELIQVGKEGSIYVVDRDNMGHYNSQNNSQIIQNVAGQVGGVFSTPTYWNGNVYFGGSQDYLKAFSLTNGLLSTTPTSQSTIKFKYPGPNPTISANGNTNGVVWVIESDNQSNGNEVLRAYDANNLATELYDTNQIPARDNPGGQVKYAVPTIANGMVYVGSAVALNVYGLTGTPPAATPAFSPANGTYVGTQTVSISSSPYATVYYTTDGSDPTTSSPVYSEPITVSTTTIVKAMATAPGCTPSIVSTAVFTILPTQGGGSVNYGSGLSSKGLGVNGNATFVGTRLRLTDGGQGERSSAWYATLVNVQNFTEDFSFQLTSAVGDGIAFVIQNAGTTQLGPSGAGLGYGAVNPGGTPGIPSSVAVKFDLYNNFGEGVDSTGLYTDGASPTIPAIDMTSSGVNLHSGDIMNVHMTYDGVTLSMTLTDTVTNAVFTTSWPIDIPGTVGAPTAYIGFTGASGDATAVQDILDWTYVAPYTISYLKGFTSTGLALNGSAALNGTKIRLTNGQPSEQSSAWFSTPVNITSFDTQFSFQPTQATANGITFAIQNAGPTALGPAGAGLGYGASSPGGSPGIPNSIAIKFDLYNGFGEGSDSTGLYTDGASPTIPAIDMTASGVNLHSGDPFRVHVTYNGTTLVMRITDKVTQATFLTSWHINIPATLGGNTGYVGFTGATGGATAIQDVLTLIYTH
ncbi:MAG: chitobiase/beta-hexosaminidase C-terminal domain-containing protein [Candidatus Korobacteraceae bacterium]